MSEVIRQNVWDVFRNWERVTAKDLVKAGASRNAVVNYLRSWEASGDIVFVEKVGPKSEQVYARVSDRADPPPVQRRDGSPTARGRSGKHLWTAMRMLKEFTPRDLAAHASTSTVALTERDAQLFCAMCLRAGYLRVIRKAVPGKREARYRLVRDTGPKPPVEKRIRAIWDENEGAYVHIPEVAS